MKMKLIDRLLIALFSLIGIALAALLVCNLFFAHNVTIDLFGWVEALSVTVPGQIGLVAIALVLLAWSIKIFSIAFKHEREKVPMSVSVQNTEHGSVRISISALDTLISHALEHQEGIKQVKSRVINHEDSVSVEIEMSLMSDVNIPNITMLLQRSVKNYIEEYSGIAVREVTVLISSIVEVVPLPLALENKHDDAAQTYEMPAEVFVEAEPDRDDLVTEQPERTEAVPEPEEAVEAEGAEAPDETFTMSD